MKELGIKAMFKLIDIKRSSIFIAFFFCSTSLSADEGYVVNTFNGCDYFIADGTNGLYVLEWYGGHDPSEGDTIEGEIGSYGMKEVTYNGYFSGSVWVEDFLESNSAARDEINDHCN